MAVIRTTRGDLDERDLSRTLGFEDRPEEFVVWVEWRTADGELVRRDAHLILKYPTLVADAIAGGM